MSQTILEQYGLVTIYTEGNHPSPIYHVDGQAQPNPHGDLQLLLDDDNLEEVMYNGGQQEVKVAHRKYGMCRTNLIIEMTQDYKLQRTSPLTPMFHWATGLGWCQFLMGACMTVPV